MGHHNGLWLAFSEDSGVEKLLNHESYQECFFFIYENYEQDNDSW